MATAVLRARLQTRGGRFATLTSKDYGPLVVGAYYRGLALNSARMSES